MPTDRAAPQLHFADNLDAEDAVALGLPAGRLTLLGLGLALALALGQAPLPGALRLGAGSLLAVLSCLLAWVRVEGISLARWAWLALHFAMRQLAESRAPGSSWVPEAGAPVSSGRGPAEGVSRGRWAA